MSKKNFQRLIATIAIIFVWVIDIPGIFKDILIILLNIAIILSTFDFIKEKKEK